MAEGSSVLEPPLTVSCMKVLDKKKFDRNITVKVVVVDESKVGGILNCKAFKKLILTIRGVKPVQRLPDGKRAILLDDQQLTHVKDVEKYLKSMASLGEVYAVATVLLLKN